MGMVTESSLILGGPVVVFFIYNKFNIPSLLKILLYTLHREPQMKMLRKDNELCGLELLQNCMFLFLYL